MQETAIDVISTLRVSPFKPEVTIVIFIHCKAKIAVAIFDLQWIKTTWSGCKLKYKSLLLNQFNDNFRSKTPRF